MYTPSTTDSCATQTSKALMSAAAAPRVGPPRVEYDLPEHVPHDEHDLAREVALFGADLNTTKTGFGMVAPGLGAVH